MSADLYKRPSRAEIAASLGLAEREPVPVDRREELEAALWRAANDIARCQATGRCRACETWMNAALAAADAYAEAVADDRIAGHVTSRAIGRERLDEAKAEKFGSGR